MTPFQTVLEHFKFPDYIEPHPLQVGEIDRLAPLNNSGEWLEMGTGKTFVSTACSLYHRLVYGHVTLVIVPPLLIPQWGRWLRSLKPDFKVVEYKGSPADRKALNLDGADFVVVGIQIFKKEYSRFVAHYADKPTTVIVDEATMIGNVSGSTKKVNGKSVAVTSDAHEKVFEFCTGRAVMLLSGTPINKPTDGYGLLKFTAPGTYRNLKHFENMHVEERDFFKQPTKWCNLDVLEKNIMLNSGRILFTDMYPYIELPLYVPLNYDLSIDHAKLYRKLASEQLLKLPDGGKIDGTTTNRLRHALGQIVMNQGHFTGDPALTADGVGLIEQRLSELGSGKLVVFANYRMTVSMLVEKLKKYKAVGINSEVTAAKKEKNIQKFIMDPECRVIVIQFISGGKGLDGLQHVCHHCMFVEPCEQPRDFHQCVARLMRLGQKRRVVVTIATAIGTLQIRGFKNLLRNDGLVNKVIRSAVDLKKEIFGESDD